MTNLATEILGIDIGGANLKYASDDERCLERFFPMWTHWNRLGEQLANDIAVFGHPKVLAITMTGELADCFDSRREGVRHLVDCVDGLNIDSIKCVRFYGTDGRFHLAEQAKANWQSIAASNWHALASCVGSDIAPNSLLIDVGSTTTDVIALSGGQVVTDAGTDMQRLQNQSLVYVGCRRTPVCALVSAYRFRGSEVPVMNEVFATIDDARLWLRLQDERIEEKDTADGKPRDRYHAKSRLVRMIGLDHDEVSDDETASIAEQVCHAAAEPIASATAFWSDSFGGDTITPTWVLSGHGQDLVRVPEGVSVVDLRTHLPDGVSRVAPAWATARLISKHLSQPK